MSAGDARQRVLPGKPITDRTRRASACRGFGVSVSLTITG